jgi:hypothetical protein
MSFQVLGSNLVAAAAGTDATFEVGVVPTSYAQGTYVVARASLTSSALVTGATATQITFTLQNRRAGTVVGTIATLVTATGTDLPAGREVAMTLSSTAGATSVNAGDSIELVLTHSGAGTAYGAIKVQVELL